MLRSALSPAHAPIRHLPAWDTQQHCPSQRRQPLTTSEKTLKFGAAPCVGQASAGSTMTSHGLQPNVPTAQFLPSDVEQLLVGVEAEQTKLRQQIEVQAVEKKKALDLARQSDTEQRKATEELHLLQAKLTEAKQRQQALRQVIKQKSDKDIRLGSSLERESARLKADM